MANRIAAQTLESRRTPALDDLRNVFEKAVGEIYRADLNPNRQRQAPIVSRARILGISSVSAEKRALSDAARALALLWKV
jgi:hypothetical protein